MCSSVQGVLLIALLSPGQKKQPKYFKAQVGPLSIVITTRLLFQLLNVSPLVLKLNLKAIMD